MRPPDEITIFYYLFWGIILGGAGIAALVASIGFIWATERIVKRLRRAL